ncbi:hypothetical protein BDV36DRAFT_6384 [Aspergillus pseudocaelatus]|uniref:Uncharacterized protein n=1 Tax=Aspergillus pseudocaelatus TaxID=1825620 RepID=A0ABQ6WYG6_9EURO|nr:hypothetical protein BDV36DRAFT_6384 [Aspergillus pseudocaelatus]
MERIKDSPIADPTVSSSVAPVVLIQNLNGRGLAMSMVEVAAVMRECVCESSRKRLGYVSGGITAVDHNPTEFQGRSVARKSHKGK